VTVRRQDTVSCGWWVVTEPDRGAVVSEQEPCSPGEVCPVPHFCVSVAGLHVNRRGRTPSGSPRPQGISPFTDPTSVLTIDTARLEAERSRIYKIYVNWRPTVERVAGVAMTQPARADQIASRTR